MIHKIINFRLNYIVLALALFLFTLQVTVSLAEDDVASSSSELLSMHAGPEGAAETLLRAHRYDSKAIMATALGYTLGINGFPKDPWLGAAWIPSLTFLVDYADIGTLNILAFHETDPEHQNADAIINNCPGVQDSPLARTLKEAQLADVAQICSQLEKRGAKHSVDDPKRRLTEATQKAEEKTGRAMALMRELRARSADKEDCVKLTELLVDFPAGVLLFYAASTHDPASQQADVAPRLLLDFVARQAESKCPDDSLAFLKEKAADQAPYLADSNLGGAREAILLAHSGDVKAARSMADYYANGIKGFLHNEKLRIAWLQRPALEGDVWSMLRFAAYLFAHGHPVQAWAWADFVTDAAAADASARHLAQSMADAVEATTSEELLEEGVEYQAAFMTEMQKRLKGREAEPAE